MEDFGSASFVPVGDPRGDIITSCVFLTGPRPETVLLSPLFSRPAGGRLGEEGRGDEGPTGRRTPESWKTSDRRVSSGGRSTGRYHHLVRFPNRTSTRNGPAFLPLLPAGGGEAGRRGAGGWGCDGGEDARV